MPKRKISKKGKIRLATYGFLSLFLICYFLITLGTYTYRIITLKNEEQVLQNQLTKLETEQSQLEAEIIKLNDPAYVASYARENYQYSREGELIIQINEDEEIVVKEETNHYWLYYIGGIILLPVSILIVRKKLSS